eukprot:Sspe_Gene.41321::Locus_19982_Transcript_1_1_Confidence_1.000_Length_1046::g.41321::m.41321/K14686/SLC31A1, CTR1; solute carrier family 31 (copper transporter), member 1
MQMQMTFTTGYEVQILFETWRTHTLDEYIIACLMIIIMSVFMQISRAMAISRRPPHFSVKKDVEDCLAHLILYAASLIMSYLLMLIVMTYNVGLFASVVTGQVIGYAIASSCFATVPAEGDGCDIVGH